MKGIKSKVIIAKNEMNFNIVFLDEEEGVSIQECRGEKTPTNGIAIIVVMEMIDNGIIELVIISCRVRY